MARTINTVKTMTTKNKEDMTYNERLDSVGIKRIYPDGITDNSIVNWGTVKVELEYNGKRIIRPTAESVIRVVKREFGLDM
jgi:hypothetical protein